MSWFLSTERMLAAPSVKEQNVKCRSLFWSVFGGCPSDKCPLNFCLKKGGFLFCVEGFVSDALDWSP